jgi:hypothetical protein
LKAAQAVELAAEVGFFPLEGTYSETVRFTAGNTQVNQVQLVVITPGESFSLGTATYTRIAPSTYLYHRAYAQPVCFRFGQWA